MSSIFVSQPGQVSAYALPGVVPAYLAQINANTSGNANQLFISNKIIITGVSTQNKSNTNFQYTLQQAIYVYGFGEDLVELRVSGVAIFSPCSGVSVNAGSTGPDDLLDFYNRFSVSNLTVGGVASTINVLFGTTAIEGFLEDLTTNTADAKSLLTSFSMGIRGTLNPSANIISIR